MPLKSYKICSKIFEHGNDPPPFWMMFKKTADLVKEGTPKKQSFRFEEGEWWWGAIVNTVSSPSQAKQHVAPRAATRSLQIPSSTSLPLVKLGQNRYEPPASMFAKSQTDWPFGWSAKQAKRSNHDPAWKVKGNHGPSTTWLAANHSHPFPFPGPIARLGSFYAFTFHPIAAMVGFYLSTSPVFMLTGSAWKKNNPLCEL